MFNTVTPSAFFVSRDKQVTGRWNAIQAVVVATKFPGVDYKEGHHYILMPNHVKLQTISKPSTENLQSASKVQFSYYDAEYQVAACMAPLKTALGFNTAGYLMATSAMIT